MGQMSCGSVVRVRMPERLREAIDQEARRMAVSRSALVRQVLASGLGLAGQVSVATDGRRDGRS